MTRFRSPRTTAVLLPLSMVPRARKRAISRRLHHSFSRQEKSYVKAPFSKVFLVKRHFLFGITRKSIKRKSTRFGKDRLACMGSSKLWAGAAFCKSSQYLHNVFPKCSNHPTVTRFFPSFLLRYIKASARSINVSTVSYACTAEMPTDTDTFSRRSLCVTSVFFTS